MGALKKIPVGAVGEKSVQVTNEMTVANYHPEMPAVFGTPMMIYLMEVAASDAIVGYLPEGWVSVGVVVNVKHLAATPVGLSVTARATVISVESGTITFAVEAHDGVEKIGEGVHVRAAIDMARFERKVQGKVEKSRPVS